VCRGGISLLLRDEGWEEFDPVVGGLAAEDAVDGVQQLPRHREESLQLGSVAAQQG
jgi:hypothetical protein